MNHWSLTSHLCDGSEHICGASDKRRRGRCNMSGMKEANCHLTPLMLWSYSSVFDLEIPVRFVWPANKHRTLEGGVCQRYLGNVLLIHKVVHILFWVPASICDAVATMRIDVGLLAESGASWMANMWEDSAVVVFHCRGTDAIWNSPGIQTAFSLDRMLYSKEMAQRLNLTWLLW